MVELFYGRFIAVGVLEGIVAYFYYLKMLLSVGSFDCLLVVFICNFFYSPTPFLLIFCSDLTTVYVHPALPSS